MSCEAFFFADIMLKFCTEYLDKQYQPVRDHAKIAYRYLTTSFIFDFVPIIPFNQLLDQDNTHPFEQGFYYEYLRLFYLVKLTRLNLVIDLFKPRLMNHFIKRIFNFIRDRIVHMKYAHG